MEKKRVEGTKMICIMSQSGVGISRANGYTSGIVEYSKNLWRYKGVTSPEHLFLYLSICPGMSLR